MKNVQAPEAAMPTRNLSDVTMVMKVCQKVCMVAANLMRGF